MTFLELVNEVLVRLREPTVSTVNSTAYSRLMGLFVNDAKRQVENAWDWDVLGVNLPVVTVAGTTSYVVTGSGTRQKNITVNNVTSGRQSKLQAVPARWIEDQQQLTNSSSGTPVYFAWSGNNGTDSMVELWPVPDSAYTLQFNMTVPQVKLVADGDIISVSSDAVIEGAYARALVERGEDGGLASGEAYNLFKSTLSDLIAMESVRAMDSDTWEVV